MNQQTFQMPNNLESVSDMVLRLRGEVEDVLFDEALIRFEICITEALSNLAIHAETRHRDVPIEIALTKNGGPVQLDIFDPVGAKPFDPKDHAVDLSDVSLTAENGRGLGLILECADGVSYQPSGDRNKLVLTFQERKLDDPSSSTNQAGETP